MATRRPDLEALQVANPGYIGDIICPPLPVAGKAGTIYYADIQSDVTVQTSRSAANAPTTSTLSESSTTWTAAESIRRANIDDASRDLMGGLAKAEQVMARVVKRSVREILEERVAAAVLTNSTATNANILNDFIGAVEVGVDTLSDYGAPGEIALVGSKRVLDRVKKYAEVIARMQFTGVLPAGVRDVRNISMEQLAAVVGVSRILVGNNRHWYTQSATFQERLALVVIPSAGAMPVEELQFARQCYFPVAEQGDDLCMVESYHDDNLVADVVQARAWTNLVEFNPELCYILSGCDVLNASSTTTTTSTTTA